MLRLHAEPILGSMRVRNIEAKHIRRVLDSARNVSRTEKKGEDLSGRSKRNVRTYLHAVFAFAQKEEFVKRNVVEQVQSPRDEYVERIAVDFALAHTILDETSRADEDLRFIVPFALASGLRRGEICGLRGGDAELDTGYVTVRRAAKNVGRKGERKVIIGPTKTRSSNRTIPVFECALVALREHRKVQRERDMALGLGKRGDDAPVFDMLGDAEASLYSSWLPEERKRRALFDPNEMSRLWTRFVRARKLPKDLRFHDLRHGAASMMFASGADLKTVSVWLGHSSVAVTAAIYVRHLNQSLFEDSTKRVDAMLRKQRNVAVNA